MKRVFIITLMVLLLAGVAQAKDWALKATWTPNTEPDMSYYTLYRTDGTRAVVSTCSHVTHPTATCNFTVTVADGTEPVLSFVVTATDTTGNTSIDSDPATFRADSKSPTKPASLLIMLQ